MSVDSNEIDKILAEDDGETITNIEFLQESINNLLDPGPPYMFLAIENPYFVAGDRIEAKVLLYIPKALISASLQIITQGVEEVHIFSQGVQISQSSNKIFSLNTLIKVWDRLTPGNYMIPFSFKLPAHCPGTFYYSGQDQLKNYLKAQVSYDLIVKLASDGNSELTQVRSINVRSGSSRANPMVEIESMKIIKGICCSGKGYSVFKLCVTSTESPIANGVVRYKLIPDNGYCGAPINQVVAEVIMELEVVGKEKTYFFREVVNTIPRITWIAAYTSTVFEKDFEFQADLKLGEDHLNVSSIGTSYIKCNYFIEIKIFYDLKFMKEPEVVRIAFHVNPILSVCKETPALPTGWNAVAEDVVKLTLDNN